MKLLVFTLLISLKAFATEQIPDILIYNGKEYEWRNSSPGMAYIEKFNFQLPKDAVETTANYGYYIFTYTIENDSLFLTDITILIQKERNLDTRSVFNDFFKDTKKIHMQYSKIQTFPYGEKISLVKSNLTNTHYKHYLLFEFKDGKVVNKYDLDYKSFLTLKKKLFKKFRQTADYSKFKVTQKENLENLNKFKKRKVTMKKYLEFKILELIKTLRT